MAEYINENDYKLGINGLAVVDDNGTTQYELSSSSAPAEGDVFVTGSNGVMGFAEPNSLRKIPYAKYWSTVSPAVTDGGAILMNWTDGESGPQSSQFIEVESTDDTLIRIKQNGLYQVSYGMVFANASDDARNSMKTYVQMNTDGTTLSWFDQNGSYSYGYDRGLTYGGFSYNSATFLTNVDVDSAPLGRMLRLYISGLSVDGSVTVQGDECHFTVMRVGDAL